MKHTLPCSFTLLVAINEETNWDYRCLAYDIVLFKYQRRFEATMDGDMLAKSVYNDTHDDAR